MAEGIRVVLRDDLAYLGGAPTMCVTNHSRPYPEPTNGQRLADVQPVCRHCGRQHFAKTYVVHLHRGSAIVSTTVWAELERLDDNPFVYANPVAEPPTQGIAVDMVGGGPVQDRPVLLEKFVMPILSTP